MPRRCHGFWFRLLRANGAPAIAGWDIIIHYNPGPFLDSALFSWNRKSMTFSHPSHDQILSALDGSGFIFEQEIATVLENNGFHVETSWPYLDQDTKKSREIDLKATRRFLISEEHKLQVFVELLVECKDSRSPFVFLERQKNKREIQNHHPKEYVFPRNHYRQTISGTSYRNVPAFEHLGLSASHYYFKEQYKATQFSKIVRKGNDWIANHEGTYDSVFLPMAKALEARVKSLAGTGKTGEWRTAWLLFPVVVLRDGLMTLRIADGKRNLSERGRVTFARSMDSDVLKGDYLIDFVTSHYLQDYLHSDVGSFAKTVADLGTSSPALLRGDDA